MTRKRIDPLKERAEILGRYEAQTQKAWDALRGPAFEYEPIPCDTIEQRLAQFDAERAEIDAEADRTAEAKRVADLIMEKADDAVGKATKVVTRTPTLRIPMYGVDGKPLLGETKPYDIPKHELTAQAWDEALETFKYHLGDDVYAQVEGEIVQRLKNLLEAVSSAYDMETATTVKDQLALEGYMI